MARTKGLKSSAAKSSATAAYPELNPWEAQALDYQYSEAGLQAQAQINATATMVAAAAPYDTMIFPGLYSATGFNALRVMACMVNRPNPQVSLGHVDPTGPLVVCDPLLEDQPIIYATPGFCQLTGYTLNEVLGRNCRFLQEPGGGVEKGSTRRYVNKDMLKHLRKAIERGAEIQLEIPNFRKNGECFTNLLSIIPVNTDGHPYTIGLMYDKGT